MPHARRYYTTGMVASRRDESLRRLKIRFTAQPERLMMHRQKMFGPAIDAHAPRLLGIAMHADPGIVRADG